jgi:hypothetical protein
MEKFADRQKETDLLNYCICSLLFFRNRQNKSLYAFAESFFNHFFVHRKHIVDDLILSSNTNKVLNKVLLKVD